MKYLMDMMEDKAAAVDPSDVDAKMEVLRELHDLATSLLSGDLEADMTDEMQEDAMLMPMNKVTVAAPDEESLEEGLEKAKDVLGKTRKMF
jgi:hypothetical protein